MRQKLYMQYSNNPICDKGFTCNTTTIQYVTKALHAVQQQSNMWHKLYSQYNNSPVCDIGFAPGDVTTISYVENIMLKGHITPANNDLTFIQKDFPPYSSSLKRCF